MTKRGQIPAAQRRRLRRALRSLELSTAELRSAVAAARAAGGSVRAIASELSYSPTTIQKWLQSVPEDSERDAGTRQLELNHPQKEIKR
ncbi:helix-turn-helix domain-containing protein [Gordonia sihwensis]|uniref:helix-turn-helix domain-containing protein n=1 Tax=Gordonia sihwensis TaxID=173559 RepID=UPI003D97CB69